MLKRHVLPHLGDNRIDEITPIDMTSFFRHVQGNRASKYQLNLYAILNTMFEVAVEYDLIVSSPLRKKLHRPLNIRKRKTALSAEEIRRGSSISQTSIEPCSPVWHCRGSESVSC